MQRLAPVAFGNHQLDSLLLSCFPYNVEIMADFTTTERYRHRDVLVDWKELLPWQKDNEFILTGYRQASFSVKHSVSSIFRVHNETVNIWTHLLGAFVYSLVPLYYASELRGRYAAASMIDLLILIIYFFGVTVCFLLSTFFHTFMNHSREIWHLGNALDHLGIVLVIWGSMVPIDYFGFYCNPSLQYMYCSVATISALSCGIFTMRPRFRTPGFRLMRSFCFGILGLSAFIPVVHGIFLHGWALQNQRMSISYFVGLGLLNGLGTAIYAMRVPERWYPKVFDIYGSSHQAMHVLVASGAYSQAIGLLKAFDYWNTQKAIGQALLSSLVLLCSICLSDDILPC